MKDEYLKRYVEYIRNTGQPILKTASFDEDWEPVGPNVRQQLEQAGLIEQAMGGLMLTTSADAMISSSEEQSNEG